MTLWFVLQFNLAFLIDLIIGDPERLPHPVTIIGKAIKKVEEVLRKLATSKKAEKTAGFFLVIIIVVGSYLSIAILLFLLNKIHPVLAWIAGAWIISTTIAIKGLAKEGGKIIKLLTTKDLPEARKQVGYIVGRDTANLDEKELIRATIETVAENIVDAVIAPLLYALVGGPALAMAYRAANTLDSMCGYKNEKYFHFGYASARFDDLLNWIPARITGVLLLFSAFLLRMDWRSSFQAWRRDARQHPSPNSGIPESTVAGALGIRLGGVNVYFGEAKRRAYMGNGDIPLEAEHIEKTIKLLYMSAWLLIITHLLLCPLFQDLI